MIAKTRPSLKLSLVVLVSMVSFLGLNVRPLFSDWATWSETKRLESLARQSGHEFQNPAPVADDFAGTLSPDFWKFFFINGGGQISREHAWHIVSMTFEEGLTIEHVPDPDFHREDSDRARQPAAGQYNNITLIGGSGFRPTPSHDVALTFSSRVSQKFYGTTGVIFQPVGTVQEDGIFVKPFDMFGFAVAGEESSIQGVNGALCYLALNWMPVEVKALPVEADAWHEYEVRLRWIDRTAWLGIVKVDGAVLCEMPVPPFGPVEVHVWSDNALVLHGPRRWWEIAPAMDLKFQDGGEKQFHLETIQVSAEPRYELMNFR